MSNFDVNNCGIEKLSIELDTLKQNNIPSLFHQSSYALVCGADEVGRGCLAGPVVACCLCFKNDVPLELLGQIKDSKKLSAKKRNLLAEQIKQYSFYKIVEVSVDVIDEINILQASLKAMKQAYLELSMEVAPKFLLIDGNKSFSVDIPSFSIIQGDDKSLSIAGASIMAKVHRDELMSNLAQDFSHYGWENNAGYGTKKHLEGLEQFGVTPHHRKSFAPIKKMIAIQ